MTKSPKKYFINLAKLLLICAILYYLFTSSLLDFELILKIAYDVNFIIKIIATILFIMLLGNLKWFILLKSQKIKISFMNCFYLYYTGYTFNYFLPGGIAGDALKIGYIAKRNSKRSIAAMSIIIDRVVGLLAMILVVLFFLPSLFGKINKLKWIVLDYSHLIVPYYIFLAIATIAVIFLVFSLVNNKKLYKKITAILKRKESRIFYILLKLVRAVFAYRKSITVVVQNIILAIVIQIIISCCLFFIGQKILNQDINIFSYNLASILTQIISIVPISPGGIGIGEVSFAKILYYLNDRILLGYASVYFAFRMINILVCVPGIMLFIFGQKKLVNHH
ncbi:MAG: lysylphosphatidylglycerol synthase transmembrane domain-containing protein [Pseudomonadota bacterium]